MYIDVNNALISMLFSPNRDKNVNIPGVELTSLFKFITDKFISEKDPYYAGLILTMFFKLHEGSNAFKTVRDLIRRDEILYNMCINIDRLCICILL